MQQYLNSTPKKKKGFKDNNKRGNKSKEKYEHRQPPSTKCMITNQVKTRFPFSWKKR